MVDIIIVPLMDGPHTHEHNTYVLPKFNKQLHQIIHVFYMLEKKKSNVLQNIWKPLRLGFLF